MAQYQTETITLPVVTLTTGSHTLNVEVSDPNSNTDENSNNNVATTSITIDAVPETAMYVTVSLLTDDYADETYMEITNGSGAVIWTEGNEEVAGNIGTGNFPPPADPTSPLENNTQYDWDVPLASLECYTFSIYDYYGDGLGASQWQGTDGALDLKDNFGGTIYTISAADFGGEEHSVVRNLTVGIDEETESVFSLYPNPAKETVFLITNAGFSTGYVITDLLGKKYSQGKINSNSTSINTSALSSGSYMIKIDNKDGSSAFKSFIIK